MARQVIRTMVTMMTITTKITKVSIIFMCYSGIFLVGYLFSHENDIFNSLHSKLIEKTTIKKTDNNYIFNSFKLQQATRLV
jgi:hypothetical protein